MNSVTLIQDSSGPGGPRSVKVEVQPNTVLGFNSQGEPVVTEAATPSDIAAEAEDREEAIAAEAEARSAEISAAVLAHDKSAGAHGLSGRPRVSLIGDSITIWHRYTPLLAYNYYFNFANGKLGLPYHLVGCYATGGYSPSQIVAAGHVASAVADSSEIVIVHCGTNGLTASGGEWATVVAMWDTLIAAGKIVIGTTVLPRSDKTAMVTAANRALKLAASTRRMHLLDWSGVLLDPATGGIAAAYQVGDNVHPNYAGHWLLADPLASLLAAIAPAKNYLLPQTAGDSLLANPLMLGTGTTATSLTITGPGTETPSLVARGGGLGNWQQIVVTENAGSTKAYFITYSPPAAGTRLKAVCVFDKTDASEFPMRRIQLNTNLQSVSGGNNVGSEVHDEAYAIESPELTLVGGETYLSAEIELYGNGTIRFGQLAAVLS